MYLCCSIYIEAARWSYPLASPAHAGRAPPPPPHIHDPAWPRLADLASPSFSHSLSPRASGALGRDYEVRLLLALPLVPVSCANRCGPAADMHWHISCMQGTMRSARCLLLLHLARRPCTSPTAPPIHPAPPAAGQRRRGRQLLQ